MPLANTNFIYNKANSLNICCIEIKLTKRKFDDMWIKLPFLSIFIY